MKITRVKFKSSAQQIAGVGSSKQFIGVGDACDGAWGGGNITSMEYDQATASLHIRKGARFERVQEQERGNQPSFDVAIVPWCDISWGCGCDEKQAARDQPSNQVSQQRR